MNGYGKSTVVHLKRVKRQDNELYVYFAIFCLIKEENNIYLDRLYVHKIFVVIHKKLTKVIICGA